MAGRIVAGTAPTLQEVPLGGTTFLAPADDSYGFAVKSSGGGYTKIHPDGTIEPADNIIMVSDKTVDGLDISEDPLVPKHFVDILGSNIATNGTTEVDLVWDGTTAAFYRGFSFDSSGFDIIECESAGLYSISCSVNSDYNSNDQLMRLYMYHTDDGAVSSLAKVTGANRSQHTSSALGVQVSLVNYPMNLNVGDLLKFTCNFTAADAGSYFLVAGTNVSIVKLH